jgi:hypothetical protein
VVAGRTRRAFALPRGLLPGLLLCFSLAECKKDPPRETVWNKETSQFVAREITVRGRVVDVSTPRKRNTFLNFGAKHPGRTFFAVIFARDSAGFLRPRRYAGRTVERSGTAKSRRGKQEIILKRSPGFELRSEPLTILAEARYKTDASGRQSKTSRSLVPGESDVEVFDRPVCRNMA